eukprot:g20586.t1
MVAGFKSGACLGLGDNLEDAMIHEHNNPDEGLVPRYDDSALLLHDSAKGGTVEIPRPNLPSTEGAPRGAALALPVTSTAPPQLMHKENAKSLLEDPSLDPRRREGKVTEELLTWSEAISAAIDSFEKKQNETHPDQDGNSEGEESETDEASMLLFNKGQFVPASGGRPIKSTMASYKDKYKRLYVPLMKGVGLSSRRKHASVTSLDLLFKTMRLCGDFPQSRHTYYSQIKGHIEMTSCLNAEASRKYDKNFGILMGMRKRPHQQTGFRASDMARIAQRLGGSLLKNEEVISKRVQHDELVAETVLECCCKYLPRTSICLCPVHCISDEDWQVMQRALKIQSNARKKALLAEAKAREPGAEELYDDDKDMYRPSEAKWGEAIRRILEICGIPNPKIGADPSKGKTGRHAFGPYSVRVGGCQSARDSHTPEDYIQCIGRWLSANTKDHYKGLAAALPDRLAFAWPIRKSVVFGPNTNFNSNYDWVATLRQADLSSLDVNEL